MVKEPDNPYDPNAIVVQSLSGQTLGYVPKDHTARFPHDTTFGHVYSMGPVSSVGLLGATVSHQPVCKHSAHTPRLLSYNLLGAFAVAPHPSGNLSYSTVVAFALHQKIQSSSGFGHALELSSAQHCTSEFKSGCVATQVAVRPTLPPLTVDVIPANLAPHVSLSSSLAKADWEAIWADTCNKANYR